jgi:hypothetical protein
MFSFLDFLATLSIEERAQAQELHATDATENTLVIEE